MNIPLIINQLIKFLWIWTLMLSGAYFIVDTEWYFIVIAILYTTSLNDLFVHRICAHNMFKLDPSRILYKVLTWLVSVDVAYGPVRVTTLIHTLHHKYSDQNIYDFANWRYHWYSYCSLIGIPGRDFMPPDKDKYHKRQYKHYGHILNDKWSIFCEKNELAISIGTYTVLFFTLPTVFEILVIGRLLATIMTSAANIAGHVKNFPLSYRNFDLKDQTSNSLIFHYLCLGHYDGMLQNNHHGRPAHKNPNPRWFEFDTSMPMRELFKFFLEKK